MGGRTKIWTAEEERQVKEMAAAGYSASEIGRVLGRTRNSVIGRCHRNNEKLQNKGAGVATWTAERYQRLQQLFADGLTLAEMAAEMGVPRGVITKRLWMMRKRGQIAGRAAVVVRAPSVAPRRLWVWSGQEIIEHGEPTSGVTLLELGDAECHYIYGDVNGAETRYCGRISVPGLSWCAGHARVVFNWVRQ